MRTFSVAGLLGCCLSVLAQNGAAGAPKRPNVVIVITDGFTPWPTQAPPRTRVVVALVGSGAPIPPHWATVVQVEDED